MSTVPTSRRRGFVVAAALALVAIGGAACSTNASSESTDATVSTEAKAAAEMICPIMWTWVKDIGEVFNVAAADMATIDDADARRERWFAAFDEMDERNADLATTVGEFVDDPILAPLAGEILRDIPLAGDELDDIRQLFVNSPEIDDRERHQDRTVQVIVRIEKVVDLPKPALGPLDTDGTLIPAFQTVPSCQHAVKDVDNGSTQDNG